MDETRANAQQEYGKHYTTQVLNYPNNRCKGTKNMGFLIIFAKLFTRVELLEMNMKKILIAQIALIGMTA